METFFGFLLLIVGLLATVAKPRAHKEQHYSLKQIEAAGLLPTVKRDCRPGVAGL